MRLSLTVLIGSIAACAGRHQPLTAKVAGPPEREVRPFDLIARGVDDNGFALNPQLGYAYNDDCETGEETSRDPASCTWRFGAGDRTDGPRPCNTWPVDPVLADNLGTLLGLTCSDSPLHYPGHVNWGSGYGNAMAFEGTLAWEGFSGEGPLGDFDYNFEFRLPRKGKEPVAGLVAPPQESLHLEIDSRETLGFGAQWWAYLRQIVEGCTERAAKFVGKPEAVVIAVLGIDAEHMSRDDLMLEAHPVYALAVRTCSPGSGGGPRKSENLCKAGERFEVPACPGGTERWFVFARDRGREGYCSPRESFLNFLSPSRKPLSLPLPERKLTMRLPWRCKDKLELDPQTQFYQRGGEASVSVQHHGDDPDVLVTIGFPEGGEVDGELILKPATRHKPCAAVREPAAPPVEKSGEEVRPRFEVDKTHELHEDPHRRVARLRRLRALYPKEMEKFIEDAGKPPANLSPVSTTLVDEPVPPRKTRKTTCERADRILVPDGLATPTREPRRAARVEALALPRASPAPVSSPTPGEPARPAPPADAFCALRQDDATARFCDALTSGK